MLTTFLNQVSNYFNKRFVVAAVFPTLAFGGASLVVYVWLAGVPKTVSRWVALSVEVQVLAGVVALVASLMLAYFLESFKQAHIRLYEGYWAGIWGLGKLERSRREFHATRLDELETEQREAGQQLTAIEIDPITMQKRTLSADDQVLRDRLAAHERRLKYATFYYFPGDREYVMPTQLGNVLRAAELYSLRRYKIDSVLMWPRLLPSLPHEFREGLDDVRMSLDLLVNIATLSGGFALSWGVAILSCFRFAWLPFIVVNLGWGLAWIAYKGMLQTAVAYGEGIRTAYDLYRWKLLESFHVQEPSTREEELALWDQITQLVYRGYPPDSAVFRYKVAESSADRQTQVDISSGVPSVIGALRRLVSGTGVLLKALCRQLHPVQEQGKHLPAQFPRTESLRDTAESLRFRLLPDCQMRWVRGILIVLVLVATLALLLNAYFDVGIVPVLEEPSVAYHLIRHADLTLVRIPRARIPDEAILTDAGMIGRYTLVPVDAYVPLADGQLGPVISDDLISGTVPVVLEVSLATTFGGKLGIGQVVDLWDAGERVVSDVLVLDVQASGSCDVLLVLAVPVDLSTQVVAREEPMWWIVPKP